MIYQLANYGLHRYIIVCICISILLNTQNAPGRGYQWSYIIPLLQSSTVPASPLMPTSSYSSSTDGPYTGPECCVTVPAPQDDQSWPHRVHTTVPTIFAELILMSGADTSETELSQLKDFVFEAIKMYLCPVGQKVWYVSYRS